tara:strand:- start:827 stop:1558 length:732 start_codon:yes stop_codon:yes gene_type:complete
MPASPRGKYVPPEIWHPEAVADLLAGTPRGNLGVKQTDWINAVTKGGDGPAGTVFAAGDTSLLKRPCIAIIGARKASAEGERRAHQLARQLSAQGIVIVSGLAEGIDTAALTSAIEHGGDVVAVIGTPLDQSYPAKNKKLQETIYHDHLLISQFPSGSRVFPSNFPARNRTMAVLSDASIVIEASDSSGSLHQAAECVRLDRWLGIAKSVLDDPSLTWPARFLGYKKFVALENTEQMLAKIYG